MNRASPALKMPLGLPLALAAMALVLLWTPAALAEEEWETCTGCHEESLVAQYAGSVHGRLGSHETKGQAVGCGSCHGAVEAHVESGDPADILGFSDKSPEETAATCSACHSGGHFSGWYGSEHQLAEIGCSDCHAIHPKAEEVQVQLRSPETCYRCHADTQAEFMMPSRHPVMERKMTCIDCHDAHGSFVGGIRSEERYNDLCFDCHTNKQGPYVFEHAPVVEDCGICHAPHGAVANNLLLQSEPFVCLQCHEFHFHAMTQSNPGTEYTTGEAPFDGAGWADQPTQTFQNPHGEWSNKVAWTTKCSQCHHQIHGSDLPSPSTAGQGQGLTR